MANLFDILKTYRPRRVIQSDDFNDLNAAVKASFQKLGDAPAAGEKGVQEVHRMIKQFGVDVVQEGAFGGG